MLCGRRERQQLAVRRGTRYSEPDSTPGGNGPLCARLEFGPGGARHQIVKRIERLLAVEEHRMDQKEHTAQLTTLFVDCNSTREKLAVVIDRNTLALNETTGVIRELRVKP